jgi:hypothetical protein
MGNSGEKSMITRHHYGRPLENHLPRFVFLVVLAVTCAAAAVADDDAQLPRKAAEALRRATTFFTREVSTQGGYLWRYSEDLRAREGEGRAGDTTVWVQPPGTPTVAGALLDAYEATGGESQGVLRTLLLLYQHTQDRRFLEPIPRAIAYFRRSQLPDGQLARFYELQTNRPLYFTRQYVLTYRDDDLPTHYAFKVGNSIDRIAREYTRLAELEPAALTREIDSRPAGKPSSDFPFVGQ